MSSTDLDETAQALVANGKGILAADGGRSPGRSASPSVALCRTKRLKLGMEKPKNFGAGKRAFYHRARCTSAGGRARYSPSMENELAAA